MLVKNLVDQLINWQVQRSDAHFSATPDTFATPNTRLFLSLRISARKSIVLPFKFIASGSGVGETRQVHLHIDIREAILESKKRRS